MKFIDLIKEPSDDKLLKKAKTIFSVLRKGKITRSDGVSFSYELGGKTFARVHEGEIELVGSVISIKENTYCPINERYMTELIENKFKMFGINVELRPPTEDQIEKYKGKKPWEEPLNEEIDRAYLKKLKKKGELVYKLFKKGKLVSDREDGEIHYTYELSDNKLINAYGDTISISPDNIKIKYHNELTNKFALLPITDSIKKRFHNHGITLNIPRWTEIYIDKWEEQIDLNENHEEYKEKQIKKARTIYKALRRGTIGGDNPEEPHFTYVLSDDFSVDTTNAGIVISLQKIKIKHLNRGCLLHSTDYMGSLIRKRFNLFGIILTNPYKDLYFDYDVDDWESPINEGAEVLNPEGLTKNEIRKAKTLYKLLKKGHFKYDDERSTYGYILPENYYIYKDELGDVCIKLTGEEETKMLSKVKMARPSDNFDILILPEHSNLHQWIKTKVVEKFEGFNIKFIF